jgi:phosphoesterase RecJ-like protein
MPDMEGIVDHARSLATVEIALFAIELEEGIRISLRSKSVDVSILAAEFGGGGHALAAGLTLAKSDLQETIDIILDRIHTQGLLDGKK